MNLIVILVIAGLFAYFAQRFAFRKRPARRPPNLTGWIEVLSSAREVLMVGRRIAPVARLGDGAMAPWGAVALGAGDPQLIADIASVTTPVYLDDTHLFAKVIVAADEGETLIVGELTDAA